MRDFGAWATPRQPPRDIFFPAQPPIDDLTGPENVTRTGPHPSAQRVAAPAGRPSDAHQPPLSRTRSERWRRPARAGSHPAAGPPTVGRRPPEVPPARRLGDRSTG